MTAHQQYSVIAEIRSMGRCGIRCGLQDHWEKIGRYRIRKDHGCILEPGHPGKCDFIRTCKASLP